MKKKSIRVLISQLLLRVIFSTFHGQKYSFLSQNRLSLRIEIMSVKEIVVLYRHSSFNAVLLYRGIPSNAGFLSPKTALYFHLMRFFHGQMSKNVKKKSNFFLRFQIHLLVKFLGNADDSNSNLSLLLSIISGQVLHVKGHYCFKKCYTYFLSFIRNNLFI